MAKANTFALDRFLPYRLSLLSNTISRVIATTYEKPFGLSIHEWRVIAVLGQFPGITATEIIQRTAIDKVTISRAVKRLISKGVISRESLETDRRCNVLALTESGREIYRKVIPAAQAYENAILNGLSEQERLALDRVLEKLQSSAASLLAADSG